MKKEKEYFEGLYTRYHLRAWVKPDPLQFLYHYPDVTDRAVAAIISACLSYGDTEQTIKILGSVFEKMGRPRPFVQNATPALLKKTFKGFKYRSTEAEEFCTFLGAIRQILKEYGSLQACFITHYHLNTPTLAIPTKEFARKLRAYGPINSLVPDPDSANPLRRLNLFLRWMVRCDEVDPGGWNEVKPAQLIIPLDAPLHRTAYKAGLTRRTSQDLPCALEITQALARFCPQDPLKYHFSLTRAGQEGPRKQEDWGAPL